MVTNYFSLDFKNKKACFESWHTCANWNSLSPSSCFPDTFTPFARRPLVEQPFSFSALRCEGPHRQQRQGLLYPLEQAVPEAVLLLPLCTDWWWLIAINFASSSLLRDPRAKTRDGPPKAASRATAVPWFLFGYFFLPFFLSFLSNSGQSKGHSTARLFGLDVFLYVGVGVSNLSTCSC